MQLTAAVINAGLGDLSIGLEMAGFDVVAAYEAEEKALSIHSHNMKVPLYSPTTKLSIKPVRIPLSAAIA